MNLFERYLTVWVFLCIVAGIALGQMLPGVFQTVGRMEIAQVNLPVGLLGRMAMPWIGNWPWRSTSSRGGASSKSH